MFDPTIILRWALAPKNWPLIGLGALLAVCMALYATTALQRHEIHSLQGKAANATDAATVARGDAESAQAASNITAAGADRDAAITAKSEAHAHAIQSTPGHDAPVPRAVNDAARRGLCDYDSQRDDPACVQLRQPHP